MGRQERGAVGDYIETGKDVVLLLTNSGINAHPEAAEEMEKQLSSAVSTLLSYAVSEERRLRRALVMGIEMGLRIAAVWSQLRLKAMRFAEGKDPETGEPVKEVADA
jgi:hypothetical protein